MFNFNLPIHPSLVHFPIALLITGAFVAVLSRLLHKSEWENWGVISLLLGWILTLPALVTGLIDKNALPPDSPAAAAANLHTTLMIAMWVTFGLVLYLYYIWKKKEQLNGIRLWLWLLVLLAAAILLVLAGHQGARLVYELGVGAVQ